MKMFNKILSAVFAALFCIVCMANIASPKSGYSENENRFLEKMPSLTLETVKNGDFMRNFEKYTTDQFVLRDFFVSLKARLEKLFLKTENNGVYFAKDGYLIEKPSDYDEKVRETNIEALKKLSELNRYKITLTLIPGSYEILSDKLPKNAYTPVMTDAMTEIANSLKDSGITFFDPADILKNQKDEYIYYRTDHHQTTKGGYAVYNALSQTLGYTPYKETDFDIRSVTDKFLGTTWSKAMISKKNADTITEYTLKNGPSFTVDFPYENKKSDSLYFPSHLDEKDKYAYFLDGNHGLEVIESSQKNGKQLMVIKDSYAHDIVPFLANHYEKIHMVDLRYFNTDILEYLFENNIKEILGLYSLSGFLSDNNLSKVYSWCENSPYAKQPFGMVFDTPQVDNSYFDDAVFVGDSLTEGLKLYNSLSPNRFLSYIGMSMYGIDNKKFPDANGNPAYNAIDMIAASNANKVYIMLGTNDEISPKAQGYYIDNYTRFIDNIRAVKPNAIIYIQSILPVTPQKETEGRFHNSYIYSYNEALLNLAKEKKCYYLDIKSICADANGNMAAGISPDGIHLDVTHYQKWFSYLKTHAVDAEKYASSDGGGIEFSKDVIPSNDEEKNIAEALKQGVGFTDTLWQIDNSIGVSLYGISSSCVKSAVVYAGSGATAEEIAVFEYASEEAKQEIYNKINEHLSDRKNSFENYLPSEVVKLSAPYVRTTDKYIILCVSDHNEKADEILNDYAN